MCYITADLPICIIEVEAILTSSSSCSILSLIQNGSVHDIRPAVGKTIHGSKGFLLVLYILYFDLYLHFSQLG